MDDEFRNQKVEFWKEILSPRLMALRFGSLGGIFAGIIAAIADVPVIHSVARTLVAVLLFSCLGLAAGYVLSSLDVERIILSSEYSVGEFLVLEDEGEFLGDVDDDILSTEIYEEEPPESLDDEKMAVAASAIKGMAGMTETAEVQALPEPTLEALPEIDESVTARQARKLVVSDKPAVEEKALNLVAPQAKELVKEIAAPAPKARRSRKLVVS